MTVDHRLVGGEILGLRQRRTGGFLPAVLDAAINDCRHRADREQDGQHHDAYLMAVEKRLECVRPLGNFGKRGGGCGKIGGHGGNNGELRRPIKAAAASKSMRKSGSFPKSGNARSAGF